MKYIVESAKEKGPHSLDDHIKPMWTICPFCQVGFDVIGTLEEFDEDIDFIARSLNLKVDIIETRVHELLSCPCRTG